jgi:hypothetical protein
LFTSLEDTSIFIISFFQMQHYVHLAFQMLVKNFLFETLFVYRIFIDPMDNFFYVAYFRRNVFKARNLFGVPLEIKWFYDYCLDKTVRFLTNCVWGLRN